VEPGSLEWLDAGLLEHADVAYRVCRRATGHDADAEDAFQNAAMELVRRAGSFRPGTNLRAWILAHMHRQAANLAKARRRLRARERASAEQDPRSRTMEEPGDDLERQEQIACVRQAMAALALDDRTVVELRYYEGLADREVAAVLGIREKAAAQRIRRALERLRQAVGRGVALALLLGFLEEAGAREREIPIPATLRGWLEQMLRDAACADAGGSRGGCIRLQRGVMAMVRSPLTYVVLIAVLALGIWMRGGVKSDGTISASATAGEGKVLPFEKAADPEVRELASSGNAFAAALYRKLSETEKGNLFFSPFSIRTALAMTYAGAQGETAAEMKKTLRFPLEDARLHAAFQSMLASLDTGDGASHTFKIANSLWGKEGYTFLQPFLDANATYYRAGLQTVRFPDPGRTTINQWVEERTHQKIKDLIPPNGVDALTRLVLVNAVYFYGSWERAFDKSETRDEPFLMAAGASKTVKMMRHDISEEKETPEFRYLEAQDLQAVELLYRGGEIGMVIVLPKAKDGLEALEKSLLAAGADGTVLLNARLAALGKAHAREVVVQIPRWRMTWGTTDVRPALESMGMAMPFDERRADFSGMNGIRPPAYQALHISKVFHKAFVDVNEEGTEAAAATAVALLGVSMRPPVFRADHPFLFLIRETKTGQILFLGRVVDPGV